VFSLDLGGILFTLPDHAAFRVICHPWAECLLRSMYFPNLKSLTPPTTNVQKMIQNIENVVVFGS